MHGSGPSEMYSVVQGIEQVLIPVVFKMVAPTRCLIVRNITLSTMMKRSNVIIYMVSISHELYHPGSVVTMRQSVLSGGLIFRSRSSRSLGTDRDLTMRSSVVIGLLRGQGPL